MATTLAQAKLNTTEDLDLQLIDEFRKESAILDRLQFAPVVNPVGGGATLTYTYSRVLAERGAAFRAVNTEYTDAAATRARASVDLLPLGGSFSIDRVLTSLGPVATGEVAFQLAQLVKGVRAQFQDSVINGTGDGDFNDAGGSPGLGFEGLDSILTGTAMEFGVSTTNTIPAEYDWAGVGTQAEAFAAMEVIDGLLDALEGGRPDVIMANKRAILRLKQIGRYAGYLSQTEDAFGRKVDAFDGIQLVDLGKGAGPSAVDIVPVESRDLDGGGGTAAATGLSDIYVVRFGMDSFHAVTCAGAPLVRTWLPDFSTAGAVKKGEAEMGPVAVVLKSTTGAAVLRNVKVQ